MDFDTDNDLLDSWAGKTFVFTIDDDLADAWAHESGEATHVRFYSARDEAADLMVSSFQDYLEELRLVDGDQEWSNPDLIPIASVGGEGDDDDEFFGSSFAFLLYSKDNGVVVSATTDDWDLTPIGTPAELGPHFS